MLAASSSAEALATCRTLLPSLSIDQTSEEVKPSPHRVLEHLVECGPLIAALGATDPLILVGLHDLPATMSGNPVKNQPLIFRRLIVTANAQVDQLLQRPKSATVAFAP